MDVSYIAQIQKQYNLDLLRQSTVIIFSPKVIKRVLILETSQLLRNEGFHLQLVNTRLIKQLIQNSRFSFLRPLIAGPIMLASSPKNLEMIDLNKLINQVEDKLSFNGVLLNTQMFLTKKRLSLTLIPPVIQLYSVLHFYLFFSTYCINYKTNLNLNI
jgi:hypothetical protein